MGSNWLSNSSPKGEVDREAGRRGSTKRPDPPPGWRTQPAWAAASASDIL